MKKFINVILSAFFPSRCAYCGKVVADNRIPCEQCEKSLPRISGKVCAKCGREKDSCFCKKAEKYYDGIAAPFYFEGKVRKGVHAFKFRHWICNAEAYGAEMSKTVTERFGNVDFDFITVVPLSDKSRRERGYNQCELLAEKISENLNFELKKGVIVKIYETQKQHTINPVLRKGNLTGVFEVPEPSIVEGKNILLCDDISTTGETLNECAKMLWLYGAKSVYCISLALTKKKTK